MADRTGATRSFIGGFLTPGHAVSERSTSGENTPLRLDPPAAARGDACRVPAVTRAVNSRVGMWRPVGRARTPDDLEAQEGQKPDRDPRVRNPGASDSGIVVPRRLLRKLLQRIEQGLDPINVVR